ncbi:MAG: metal ABC transporter permease [Thermochromatium sp.]
MDSFLAALQLDFMRNALVAGLLVSLAAGIMGVYVVLNRIATLSGGIAHAAYGGVGMAYYFGFDPLLGGLLFSVIAALSMNLIQRKTRQRADTLVGVMWAVGMAIGIIFVDRAPGYKVDLMSFLFGSLLAVSPQEIYLIIALDVIVLLTVFALYRELLAISYDEAFSTVRNLPVDAISLILTALIALTVVMMMRVVGLILVIALLTLPAAIATLFARSMRQMMVLASLFGALFTLVGLWLSYQYNLTSGAAIILVAAAAYLLALVAKRTLAKASGQKQQADIGLPGARSGIL